MERVSFDSPYYPYVREQEGFNSFDGAEEIPLKILLYLMDMADGSGYEPQDDNNRPRVRLMKYLWHDGAAPLDGELPTDAEKRSMLFDGAQPDINTDEQMQQHPRGYRLYAQPYWLPAQQDAKTVLKCYIGKVTPVSPFMAAIGLTFEIAINYGQETNTRSDAYSRAYAMECALITALNGVNIAGVGTVMFSRAAHMDAGSRIYHDEGSHIYRVVNLSVNWMESRNAPDNKFTEKKPDIAVRPLTVTKKRDV